jgi:arginase
MPVVGELGIARISAVDVHTDVQAAAARARARAEAAAPQFVVHCDVDVLAFVGAPLADVPDSGGSPVGLTLDELATSLVTFGGSLRFAGLVLTEVNPDHVPDQSVLRRFVETLTAALA